jgi:hypothetical protein
VTLPLHSLKIFPFRKINKQSDEQQRQREERNTFQTAKGRRKKNQIGFSQKQPIHKGNIAFHHTTY